MEKKGILLVKVNNLYVDQSVYFGTIHLKEEAIRPLLLDYGINCIPIGIDSDSLGTFSGEVKRLGTVTENLRAKIKLIQNKVPEARLFLASEGSFGPHPFLPFLNCNEESLMFYDAKLDLEITASEISTNTNLNELIITHNTSLKDFINAVKFPSHGLILATDKGMIKGITKLELLDTLIAEALNDSDLKSIKLFTDMRANFNPTRMSFIGDVGKILLEKIFSLCPNCRLPGYAITKLIPGLPCQDCGFPTKKVLLNVYQCSQCHFQEQKERSDNVLYSDPADCDNCNP